MLFRRKDEVIEFPEEVLIETTNRCNARCVFCHHPKMKRPLTDMSDQLFSKLLGDIKEMKVKIVTPFVSGEIFLDKKIFERLKLLNSELPGAGIMIFTNGSLLNEERAESLSGIRNIRVINFSLNGFEAEDYRKRVGLDLAQAVKNIKNVIRLNAERKFADTITVASVEYGKEDRARNKRYNDAFCRFCADNFPGAEVKVGYKYNFLSHISSARGFKNIYCQHLKNIVIMANGLVSLCSMDMEGEYILGNANERSLLDIFNGPLAREYRHHRKSHMMPCRLCNMV